MRRLFALVVMVLACGGPALADDWAVCDNVEASDAGIKACSNIITEGRESDQKLARAYVNRGAAYGRKGDIDRAIADETKAIELDPRLAVAYSNRGIAYGAKGNLDGEIADETSAIGLDPQLSTAYASRGFAYQLKADYEREIADETKAIELSPKDGFAYFSRAMAFRAKGDAAKALSDFRGAVAVLAGTDPLYNEARLRVTELEKQLESRKLPEVTPVTASRRVALVIGNSTYQNVAKLTNPANDAKLIADALKLDGFGVTLADNLDRDGLIKALRAFAKDADSADWAVVYYAGHGIEMAGTNYLIPVDAKLATDRDVDFEAVPLNQVFNAIDGAHALRMVILDACRNNPFAASMKRTGEGRDIGRGLARIEPVRGTEVVYSAKEGTIAADGDGADSPFATELAHYLTQPGIEVDKLFRLVRDDVLKDTGDRQEPFVYGSLPGHQDFFFRPN